MYCKHCGKPIDDDSTFCCHCGRKVEPYNESNMRPKDTYVSNNDGKKIVINGETYTIRNGILFDEDGWDAGRVPSSYCANWGGPM